MEEPGWGGAVWSSSAGGFWCCVVWWCDDEPVLAVDIADYIASNFRFFRACGRFNLLFFL
jgi:hypothetical protein